MGAREVTAADFAISKTLSGVNMRLTAGGLREMHWHQAAEWAFMTAGNCRITVLDPQRRAYVADVKQGDLGISRQVTRIRSKGSVPMGASS